MTNLPPQKINVKTPSGENILFNARSMGKTPGYKKWQKLAMDPSKNHNKTKNAIKNVIGILVGLFTLYLIASVVWGLLNMKYLST